MEPGKISERQLALLMSTVLLATVIYFMPQIAARAVEHDAWITSLIATVWGIPVALVVVALARRYPGMTLIEYLPLILGKPLGKILGVLYAFWFISISALVLREFGVFLNISIMPTTPVSVFTITFALLVYYALRSGLEVWVRVNDIILPIFLIVLLAIIVLPLQYMDFSRLLPVGVHSLDSLMISSFPSASWRSEIVLAAMFIPALAAFRTTGRNLVIVVLLIGIILAIVEAVLVAIFGGVSVANLELPIFSMARMVQAGGILNRVEALVVVIFMLGNFIKFSAFLYGGVKATAQVLGFKEFQFLLLPITIFTLALAENLVQSVAGITDFLTNVWAGYGLFSFELVIPLLLYLMSLIRSGKGSGAA